uniref:Uncharacterized protein n=1 Tax=Arundo donax TaxID=35708 RepID=A0A0A9AK81_ARUDO
MDLGGASPALRRRPPRRPGLVDGLEVGVLQIPFLLTNRTELMQA